jgi:thioredoxin family protein
MRKISLIITAAIVLLACSKTNLKINGVSENNSLEGKKVYLADMDQTRFDSTEIKNGKFSFAAMNDSAKIVFIRINTDDEESLLKSFIYEKGTINVKIDAQNNISVTGTPLNDTYSEFVRQNKILDEKYEQAKQISEKAANDIDKEYVALGYKFAKENAKNLVGQIAFLSAYWGMSIEQREEIISLLDDKLKKDPKIAKVISNIEQEKVSAVGQPFIDFTAKDPNGKDVTLSTLMGKTDYLLIDFWASWCGPCIKSLPSLKAMYDKYHGKKFDIIGVSLDNNSTNWTEAIEKFGLTWTNVSDLQEWDSQPAKLYAISFIPNTILLDKEGKIIGRNLHVNEIEEILNKK